MSIGVRRSSIVTLAPKAIVYARLAKLDIFDLYLSAAIVWTLLSPAERLEVQNVLTLLVFLLGTVCVVAATCSFDDVTGYRDGSDATNYGPDAPLRRLARKPLLAGTLTPAEAVRFGWTMAAAGTLLWTAAVVAAPYRPFWAIAVGALCLTAALQYSWGLKLSYRGLQETVLGGFGMGLVLIPYGLVSDGGLAFPAVQAVVFGLGPMLFGTYANINDRRGDAGAGRRTVAATVSERTNAAFIAAVTLSMPAIIAGSALVGVAPWWFPAAMLPTIALLGTQLVTGLRRKDVLAARRLGIRTHRVTVALLAAVNLVYPLLETNIK